MLANNTGAIVHYLAGKYEGRIGHLYSPGAERKPVFWLPFALDNRRYVCWSKGEEWDEAAYLRLLDSHGSMALWCLVPDLVADRDGTLREWDRWFPRMRGLKLAIALQDGMTMADVPSEAEVMFLGGTTEWKRRNLRTFKGRRHVGRINTERWLWECDDAGCESCDGTGWFRGDQAQLRGLLRYLDRSTRNVGPRQRSLLADDCRDGDSLLPPRDGVPAIDSTEPQESAVRRDHDRAVGKAREVA